jgi:hypothetical protein
LVSVLLGGRQVSRRPGMAMLRGSPLLMMLLLVGTVGSLAGGKIVPPPGSEELPPPAARMERVLPFSFEDVLACWEAGPTDESFLR